ncbi:MAG: ABC transporter permease [Zetaproteobacteria bacterium CG_4_9_14_3_um_filter_49_83]|nr:MAG: ABC transporter permease [Zetaproteobacteria bacterium CG17_big_fil_post_rev_8_21_14_2_50_50_13]PIV29227.1 MAG: ABC transporter permease [Zetaproteobacteria bacterium CG02_land_8_20_14_3_00_50_9]PIY56021.1 MAG: ABC transporter permease [Zetaproteobacteria bacterium CG_4_10_14_0_8_um_filter_49_80]PJA36302.1 MAG: ABC transporter permease [Zetaproteobacteria bacterium CG_4_9_14_3_um_filter_49_83]
MMSVSFDAVIRLLGSLGRFALTSLDRMGDATTLSLSSLALLFRRPWQGQHIVLQLYALGVGSFIIIAITGAFTGMVLALQGYYTLAKFGSESLLGAGVALSIIRELGPVLGALMLIGRAGSSITAEIGIMRVTEQVDALEMMAINPRARVLLPRIIATTIALPILVTMFDIIGLASGYVIGVELLGVNGGAYIGEMISKVMLQDLYAGWVKAVGFGFIIGVICTYMGYRAEPTTEGVAAATTKAVVAASVGVLIMNYVLTSFFL